MKRIRAWLYFIAFIVVLAALSTKPQVEDYFQYFWLPCILILSVVSLWRWWNNSEDSRDMGFGIGRLPLPKRWKQWIYDEPTDRKNSQI